MSNYIRNGLKALSVGDYKMGVAIFLWSTGIVVIIIIIILACGGTQLEGALEEHCLIAKDKWDTISIQDKDTISEMCKEHF